MNYGVRWGSALLAFISLALIILIARGIEVPPGKVSAHHTLQAGGHKDKKPFCPGAFSPALGVSCS